MYNQYVTRKRDHWPPGNVGNVKCHGIHDVFLLYLGAVTIAASCSGGETGLMFHNQWLQTNELKAQKEYWRGFPATLPALPAGVLCSAVPVTHSGLQQAAAQTAL